MATISTPVLTIKVDVGNAEIKVTYQITGSAFDIASGQPYREVVTLYAIDEDRQPITQLADTTVVFPNATAISRTREKTISKSSLNEDILGADEILCNVTLTPKPAETKTKDSNTVTGQFG